MRGGSEAHRVTKYRVKQTEGKARIMAQRRAEVNLLWKKRIESGWMAQRRMLTVRAIREPLDP